MFQRLSCCTVFCLLGTVVGVCNKEGTNVFRICERKLSTFNGGWGSLWVPPDDLRYLKSCTCEMDSDHNITIVMARLLGEARSGLNPVSFRASFGNASITDVSPSPILAVALDGGESLRLELERWKENQHSQDQHCIVFTSNTDRTAEQSVTIRCKALFRHSVNTESGTVSIGIILGPIIFGIFILNAVVLFIIYYKLKRRMSPISRLTKSDHNCEFRSHGDDGTTPQDRRYIGIDSCYFSKDSPIEVKTEHEANTDDIEGHTQCKMTIPHPNPKKTSWLKFRLGKGTDANCREGIIDEYEEVKVPANGDAQGSPNGNESLQNDPYIDAVSSGHKPLGEEHSPSSPGHRAGEIEQNVHFTNGSGRSVSQTNPEPDIAWEPEDEYELLHMGKTSVPVPFKNIIPHGLNAVPIKDRNTTGSPIIPQTVNAGPPKDRKPTGSPDVTPGNTTSATPEKRVNNQGFRPTQFYEDMHSPCPGNDGPQQARSNSADPVVQPTYLKKTKSECQIPSSFHGRTGLVALSGGYQTHGQICAKAASGRSTSVDETHKKKPLLKTKSERLISRPMDINNPSLKKAGIRRQNTLESTREHLEEADKGGKMPADCVYDNAEISTNQNAKGYEEQQKKPLKLPQHHGLRTATVPTPSNDPIYGNIDN